jgi:hypothetical protein
MVQGKIFRIFLVVTCLGSVRSARPMVTTCGYVALAAARQLLVGYAYQKAFTTALKYQEILDESSGREKDVTQRQNLAHLLAFLGILGSQSCFELLLAQTDFGISVLTACEGTRLHVTKHVGESLASIVKMPEKLGMLGHCANFLCVMVGIDCGMNAMAKGGRALHEFWHEKASWTQRLKGYGMACMSSAGLVASSAILQFVVNQRSRATALLLGLYQTYLLFSPMVYAVPN